MERSVPVRPGTPARATSPRSRTGTSITLASYAAQPVVLAEDSESADVTADLIDVGNGSQEGDYAGKDVKGKIVLAAAQADDVQDLAVGKFGASGIVSYAQNQKTAWSGENDNLIRWGHLKSFSPNKTFAFMVSLKTGRRMQERLSAKETIRLHAVVVAGQHPAFYEVVTAVIPGADPRLKDQEIAFSCHLDHQRPGANDNASGCVTILEVARTLQTLIGSRPARAARANHPLHLAARSRGNGDSAQCQTGIRAADQGRDPHGHGGRRPRHQGGVSRDARADEPAVIRARCGLGLRRLGEPRVLPIRGERHGRLSADRARGGREPLRAMYSAYSMGSDHDVYQDSSFGIPAIYMNDWPDRYIHTNFDTAANIDPTKLKRAGLIGAASGYFLANISPRDVPAVDRAIAAGKLQRALTAVDRQTARGPIDEYEHAVLTSLDAFVGGSPSKTRGRRSSAKGEGAVIYRRHAEPRGPMMVFGYDYFADHARAAGVATPRLLSYEGSWGAGEEYAYEALNFADGRRSAQQIADELSAEYGPVPSALVFEYLQALKRINVLE
jgi:aminopeptidase YwaD